MRAPVGLLVGGDLGGGATTDDTSNARRYHALAYDPDRQLVVLFGGLHSMAYDGLRHHVVLLGDVGMWEFFP